MEYVQKTYDRLYSTSSYHVDSRRKYESTPMEKDWLIQEAYSLNVANNNNNFVNNNNNNNESKDNSSSNNSNNVHESISKQVDKMISEILCDGPSIIESGSSNNTNNSNSCSSSSNSNSNGTSNAGFNNTINNTNFSTTNSTSINSTNNNLFLERQLLLVQRAQEFLLDEYRIGNQNKKIEKQTNIMYNL